MLAEFRDYLKTLDIAEHYYIGKIDNAQLKVIGLYSDTSERVEAFGRVSSYEVVGFRVLLHWNRNAKETEAQANLLYDTIRYIHQATMGDTYVAFIDIDKPVFLGTDENNVYEYSYSGRFYIGR